MRALQLQHSHGIPVLLTVCCLLLYRLCISCAACAAANLPILFLGRPGVGKTTAIREIARTLSDELRKRVVIVDTSNEIGGDGDVPHHAIGGARRMQVADASKQHHVMVGGADRR
jgi:stage III sporulation protein SpoIIIAA